MEICFYIFYKYLNGHGSCHGRFADEMTGPQNGMAPFIIDQDTMHVGRAAGNHVSGNNGIPRPALTIFHACQAVIDDEKEMGAFQ